MDKLLELRQKYRDKIILRRKTPIELVDWIKAKCDVAEFPLSELTRAQRESLIFNAGQTPANIRSVSDDVLRFMAYKLLDTDKNRSYFDLWDWKQNFIYVVFELETGYIYSNMPKLYLEMVIEQGITQADFDSLSFAFVNYITHMDHYENGEY